MDGVSKKLALKRLAQTAAYVSVMMVGLIVQAVEAQQQVSEQRSSHLVVTTKGARPSTKEMYFTFNKPTTPLELLANLKFALYQHLLLSDDFYTDGNLKMFLGCNKVVWYGNTATSKSAEVSDFGEVSEYAKYFTSVLDSNDHVEPVRNFPGIGRGGVYRKVLGENGKENERGKVQANVSASGSHDVRFTVDAVESILGAAEKITDPYRNDSLSHPKLLQPATHKYGNKVMVYTSDDSMSTTSLSFLINGDGTVNRFNLVEKEK